MDKNNINKLIKKREKRKYKKIINVLIALIILLLAVVIFLFAFYKYSISAISKNSSVVELTIKEGTITEIGNTLKDEGLIRNVFIFKLYTKINNKTNLKASTYKLNKNMDLENIVNILESGNSYNPDQVTITFKEGINVRKIANLIEEYTNNSKEDVLNKVNDNEYINTLINKYWFLTEDIKNNNIYYALEGYLFPNTYYFSNKDVSIEEIFTKMLDETDKKLSEYKENITNLSLSIHEFMTLASIIELEGATSNDRAAVSGVFYNRLNDGWSLGSDVTTYYASKIDDFSVSLTTDELDDCNNKYNTRCSRLTGLPVGPIDSPGLDSIKATLYPETHNYYYFVADCKGEVYLSKNSTEHYNTINKLRKENNWCA